MSQKYHNLWKEKTLDEIDALIKLDSEFHVYYLMRANYNIRRCQNEAIRSCEIKHVVIRILNNTTRLNLHAELEEKTETVKITLEKLKLKNEQIVMTCKKILSDFEKASEIFEREFKFYEQLPNSGSIDEILKSTNPVSSFEYAIRARHIAFYIPIRFSEITGDFERSLEMNSKNFFAMSFFGDHLIEKERFNLNGNGIKYIRKSCEIEPVFHYNYAVLANLYRNVEMLEFGIREFSIGAELLETVVEYDDYFKEGASLLFTMRGLIYVAIEKNELARSDFTKGIELLPGNDSAYAIRGMVNLELERYEESILDFTEAIKLGNADLDCRDGRNHAVQCWKKKIMKS